MTEEVLVSIRGLHALAEAPQEEIEVIFPGICRKLGDTWYIQYTEAVEGMNGEIRNLIKLRENSIEVKKKAEKFILKQPKRHQVLLFNAISKLPYDGDIKKVEGRGNYFRLRIGVYRIIYTVDHGKLIVAVIDANTRGQIYKRY